MLLASHGVIAETDAFVTETVAMAEDTELPLVTAFVCYSRADKDFADRLAEELEKAANIKILIDRRDLPYGERWWDMLKDFIQRCDRVLFLVSPQSVKSYYCQQEIEEMRRHGRRIIPVVVRDTSIEDLPEDIRAIQLLPFTPPNVFQTQLAKLVTALYQNVEWSRQRRVVDTLAEHWAEQKTPTTLLFGADQVAHFKSWLERRPALEPLLSTTSTRYLDFSEFYAHKETHFTDLRRMRDAVERSWMNWAFLVAGYAAVVGGACYAVVHVVSQLVYQAIGSVAVMVGGGVAALPIGRAIKSHNANLVSTLDGKVAVITHFGATAEAETFIKAKIAAEEEEAERERIKKENKELREYKEKVEKEKRAAKATGGADGQQEARPPAGAGPAVTTAASITKDAPMP